jgi:hypothetical protein
MREGLPTVRVRTFDHDGQTTGEIILDPSAVKNVALNLGVCVENLGMLIDPTGGVHHAGGQQWETEEGLVQIAWAGDGRFDGLDSNLS